MNNEVLVKTGEGPGSSTDVPRYKINFLEARKTIAELTTNDSNFAATLEEIKKILGQAFSLQFSASSPLVTISNGAADKDKPILSIPKVLFQTASLENRVLMLFAAAIKFGNVKADSGFLPHIKKKIDDRAKLADRNQVDAAVMAMLESPRADKRDTASEIAKPNPEVNPNDTAIVRGRNRERLDDTAVETSKRVKTRPNIAVPAEATVDKGSTSTSARTEQDLDTLIMLGVKVLETIPDPNGKDDQTITIERDGPYKKIATGMASTFLSDKSFKGLSIHYKDKLESELDQPEAAAQTLEKLINIFSWLSINKKPIPEFAELLNEFSNSLKEFIVEMNAGDLEGCETTQSKLIAAIGKIESKKLLSSIKNKYNEQALIEKVKALRFGYMPTKSKGQSSIGRLLSFVSQTTLNDSKAPETGLARIKKTVRDEGGSINIEKEPLETFVVDEDFVNFCFTGADGYKSIYNLVKEIGKVVKKEFSSDGDPFEGKILEELIKELDKAYVRTRDGLIPGINEIAEYLKFLTNIFNSDDTFIKICANVSLNPAEYALPYVLYNFFEERPEQRKAYLAALDLLAEKHRYFKTVKNTTLEIEHSLEAERKQKRDQAIKAQLKTIEEVNESDTKEVLTNLEKDPVNQRVQLLQKIGKVTERRFAEKGNLGFLIRLSELSLDKPEYQLLLNFDKDSTIRELYYLITGCLPLSALDKSKLEVLNLAAGKTEDLTREEFYRRYDIARKQLWTDLSPDKINNGTSLFNTIADIQAQKSSLGKQGYLTSIIGIADKCTKLLGDIENIVKTQAGWERGKFGKSLNEIYQLLHKSNSLPLVKDMALNPYLSKALFSKTTDLAQTQSTIVQVLGKIWKSMPNMFKAGSESGIINATLKQLGA